MSIFRRPISEAVAEADARRRHPGPISKAVAEANPAVEEPAPSEPDPFLVSTPGGMSFQQVFATLDPQSGQSEADDGKRAPATGKQAVQGPAESELEEACSTLRISLTMQAVGALGYAFMISQIPMRRWRGPRVIYCSAPLLLSVAGIVLALIGLIAWWKSRRRFLAGPFGQPAGMRSVRPNWDALARRQCARSTLGVAIAGLLLIVLTHLFLGFYTDARLDVLVYYSPLLPIWSAPLLLLVLVDFLKSRGAGR